MSQKMGKNRKNRSGRPASRKYAKGKTKEKDARMSRMDYLE